MEKHQVQDEKQNCSKFAAPLVMVDNLLVVISTRYFETWIEKSLALLQPSPIISFELK